MLQRSLAIAFVSVCLSVCQTLRRWYCD